MTRTPNMTCKNTELREITQNLMKQQKLEGITKPIEMTNKLNNEE